MHGIRNYVLDEEGRPKPVDDVLEWARWFEDVEGRRVAMTKVGPATVSTVFLGLDHNFGGSGDPVLWETCVFDAPDRADHMRRYTSQEKAQVGHVEVVREIQELQAARR